MRESSEALVFQKEFRVGHVERGGEQNGQRSDEFQATDHEVQRLPHFGQ